MMEHYHVGYYEQYERGKYTHVGDEESCYETLDQAMRAADWLDEYLGEDNTDEWQFTRAFHYKCEDDVCELFERCQREK